MWWVPGEPFAVGGPSKKVQRGAPSLAVMLLANISDFSQN